jgi:hypothetical protein
MAILVVVEILRLLQTVKFEKVCLKIHPNIVRNVSVPNIGNPFDFDMNQPCIPKYIPFDDLIVVKQLNIKEFLKNKPIRCRRLFIPARREYGLKNNESWFRIVGDIVYAHPLLLTKSKIICDVQGREY